MSTATAPEVIRGERITLSPLSLDNIYTHFRWNNDPELNRLDSEIPFAEESFGEFKKRFEWMMKPSPTHKDFEIHAEDGTLIGVAYITNISQDNGHCLIGITIGDRDYWGEGYGTEALELVLEFCFEEMGLHRVSTETFEYNTSWRSLVEELGFRKEGVERDYLYREDEYWDKEIYAMLEDEYRARFQA